MRNRPPGQRFHFLPVRRNRPASFLAEERSQPGPRASIEARAKGRMSQPASLQAHARHNFRCQVTPSPDAARPERERPYSLTHSEEVRPLRDHQGTYGIFSASLRLHLRLEFTTQEKLRSRHFLSWGAPKRLPQERQKYVFGPVRKLYTTNPSKAIPTIINVHI